MDRATVVALLLGGGSVVASYVGDGNMGAAVRHGLALLLPLVVIAFPEAIDIHFRRSWRGHAHGGEGPAPAALIRPVAWFLLITLVVVHHYLRMVGA